MTANPITPEEIIEAYKAAVEHAKGSLFASMLQVACDGGWFSVTDLEGTEARYRKKEIIAATNDLLAQPKYEPASETTAVATPDTAPAFNVCEAIPAESVGTAKATQTSKTVTQVEISEVAPIATTARMTGIATEEDLANMATALGQSRGHSLATSAEAPGLGGAAGFRQSEPATEDGPAPTLRGQTSADKCSGADSLPETNREREDKVYFQNLSRIFLAVGALIVVVVLFVVFRK